MIRLRSHAFAVAAILCLGALPGCTSEADPAGGAAAAESAEWFVAEDGAVRGPMTESALRAEIAGGTIGRADLVRRDGMAEWAPAAAVLGSAFGAGETDAAGAAFLELCEAAAAVSAGDRTTLSDYWDAAEGDAYVERPQNREVDAVLSRHRALLERARTEITGDGRIGLDYEQGEALLPLLARNHSGTGNLSRLLTVDARRALELGRPSTAAADVAAIGRIAQQLVRDRVLTSSMRASAVVSVFVETLALLPAEAVTADLREIIAWASGNDPMGYAEAIRTERTFMLPAGDGDSVAQCRAAYDELIALIESGQSGPSAAAERFFEKTKSGAYGPLAVTRLDHARRFLETDASIRARWRSEFARFEP